MLRTAVDLSFLTLSITVLVVMLRGYGVNYYKDDVRRDIMESGDKISLDIGRKIESTDSEVNRVSGRQDSYQGTTAKRIYVLEQRVKILEGVVESGKGAKIINTNNNIVNVSKTEERSKL